MKRRMKSSRSRATKMSKHPLNNSWRRGETQGSTPPEGANSLRRTRIMVSHDDSSPRHYVTPLPSRPKVVRPRESLRWYSSPPCRFDSVLPYIDDLGRFTGHGIYTWNCDSRSYVATVVANISRKLEVYARRHNPYHVVKSNLNRIIRVSYLYACTKNLYLWDRVLFFVRDLKKNGKLLHRTFLKFAAKCDENFRFVYSHVCSQTKWLLFRANRPRDKSHATVVKDLPENGKFRDPMFRYAAIRAIAIAMAPTAALRSNQGEEGGLPHSAPRFRVAYVPLP